MYRQEYGVELAEILEFGDDYGLPTPFELSFSPQIRLPVLLCYRYLFRWHVLDVSHCFSL
jgi:hypothetical protein